MLRLVSSPPSPSRPLATSPKLKSNTADPAWVRAMFLAPAVVGSFAALVVLGQTRGVRQRVRRWLGREAVDLDGLRASILGQGKRRVTARFGPPPAATSAPTVTWYYPIKSREPTAMAISFDGDAAAKVEFFRPPA